MSSIHGTSPRLTVQGTGSNNISISDGNKTYTFNKKDLKSEFVQKYLKENEKLSTQEILELKNLVKDLTATKGKSRLTGLFPKSQGPSAADQKEINQMIRGRIDSSGLVQHRADCDTTNGAIKTASGRKHELPKAIDKILDDEFAKLLEKSKKGADVEGLVSSYATNVRNKIGDYSDKKLDSLIGKPKEISTHLNMIADVTRQFSVHLSGESGDKLKALAQQHIDLSR